MKKNGRVLKDASGAMRIGAADSMWNDFFFHVMRQSWTRFFVVIIAFFLLANAAFAGLYLIDGAGLAGVKDASFLDAFFFSVETMSTIGYGVTSPLSIYAHFIVTCEAIFTILGTAFATGLMLAKASRPRSSVLFSDSMVVSDFDKEPTLMFRVGNARGNEIVEAQLHVVALIDRQSAEGIPLRRLHDLDLIRDHTPLFALTWQVFHTLDESSPLSNLDLDDLESSKLFAVVVTMTGYDSTYGRTIHARHIYYPEMIRIQHRFEDVLSTLDDGRLVVDYTRFHQTTEI